VSIFAWYLLFNAEDQAFVQEFDSRARNQAIILQSGINDYWDKLYAVKALFDSSNQGITRDEFSRFSQSLLEGHSAVLNFSWYPRVKREGRAAHELAAAHDGIPNYHIRTSAPDRSLPVSPEMDEYFPKFYSTEDITSPVYGLDLLGVGRGEETLNKIRDENILSTTLPLSLYIGEGSRTGFWAGVPVYAHDLPHETVEDRRRNLLGIVQGVFQIGVMIDSVLGNVATPVRVYVFAPNATPVDRPIYLASRQPVD